MFFREHRKIYAERDEDHQLIFEFLGTFEREMGDLGMSHKINQIISQIIKCFIRMYTLCTVIPCIFNTM